MTYVTAKWVGKAILAVIAGVIIGQVVQVPLALLLDFIYRADVTGGRWPLNSANIVLTVMVGFITGFSTGLIAKRRGRLLAAIAQFSPMFFFLTISIIKNVDLSEYIAQSSDTQPSLWMWIGLAPAILGGYLGEKSDSQGHLMRKILGWITGGFAGISMFVVMFGGVAIHLMTVLVAYQVSGFGSAFLAFMFPVGATIYWIVKLFNMTGHFFSDLAVAVTVYLSMIVIGSVLFFLATKLLEDKKE